MRILHIAHYDIYPRSDELFFEKPKNGIEQWLASIIKNTPSDDENFVMFFNEYDMTILVIEISADGKTGVYISFDDVVFEKEYLTVVFESVMKWIPFDIIHFHYQKDYLKDMPNVLRTLGQQAILATMHDESYLGEKYGLNNQYVYEERVKDFFENLSLIVFIHRHSEEHYYSLYREELEHKSVLIPNGINVPYVAELREEREGVHAVVLGSLNDYKGYQEIKELMNIIHNEQLPIAVEHIGQVSEGISGLQSSGPYTRKSMEESLKEMQPDVVIIPSIVEETFPYTAVEATKFGYPVLAFNVGSLADIEQEKRGIVVPERTGRGLADALLGVQQTKENHHTDWQKLFEDVKGYKSLSEKEMVDTYLKLYQELDNSEKSHHKSDMIDYRAISRQNLHHFKLRENRLYEKTMLLQEVEIKNIQLESEINEMRTVTPRLFRIMKKIIYKRNGN